MSGGGVSSAPKTGVLRVALTGGIAAGKSVVAARLVELGVGVVDHDRLAREVVAPGTAGLAEIAETFEGVVRDGELDRAALGAIVFADGDQRGRLEAVLHPRIAEAAKVAEADLVSKGARVVVHDVPLLVETGQADGFDQVVVVRAPASLRAERMVRERGLTEEQAWARIAAQAADHERDQVGDAFLDGSGQPEALRAQVDALVSGWGQGRVRGRASE